jgi:uncharacterized protein YecE (DUF72 family)
MASEVKRMVDWILGTMGFSYQDWAGIFYPETLAQRNYLGHYSRFFNAVEIDSTFYGTPRLETVTRWASATPDGFRLCPKVPRIVTHEKGLTAAHLDMAEFLAVIRELGEKLGVVLVQLPPSFDADRSEALDTFLGELPSDLRFAVEFRHPSWHKPETVQILQTHKVSWAATEYPNLPRGVNLTADFIYFRLIGQHGQFTQHNREQIDRCANLEWWYQHLQKLAGEVHSIYGFFNNDYAGFGAGSCNRFKAIAGLPVSDLRPPQQGRLF